ncbi:uncharacterized protein LOC143738123 [Siphateles boraxobius]|uniref:uncharacterized protein LOC143724578 n=1 Tax=Siphateles boraxobius TaxID=180520 RepID=UPI0040638096
MQMHKEEVIRKRLRLKPEGVALQYVRSATDNTCCLEARHINPIKGRGVFALSPFLKGDFVVEYRGERIDSAESQARRKKYHPSQAVFMFDFYWHGKQWCIDAAVENSSLGRLVNDAHFNPNCRMKKIVADGKPHLVLFALQNIERGDELTYDYGGSDWPWRVYENTNQELMESSNTRVPDINEVSPTSILKVDGEHSTNVAFEHSDQKLMESSNTRVQDINEVSPTSILKVDGEHFTNVAFEHSDQKLMESSNTRVQDINEVSPTSILKVDGEHSTNVAFEHSDQELMESSNTRVQDINEVSPTSILKVDGEHFTNVAFEHSDQELMESSNTRVQDINEVSPTSILKVDGEHSTNVAFEHSDQELMESSNTRVQDINEVSPTSILKVDGEHFTNVAFEHSDQELMESSNTRVQDINEVSPTSILKVDGEHFTNVAFEHSDQKLMESSNTRVQDINEVSPTSILKVDGEHFTNVAFEHSDQKLMESSNTRVQDINEVSPTSILKVTKKPMNSLVDYTDSDEVSSGPDFSSDLPSSSIQHLSSKSTVERENVPQFRTKSTLMEETLNWSEELFDSPESFDSSTDEEEDNIRKIVPRLRKSRNILGNQKISVGSEKLSESSQDSGEEYVPSTSGDSTDSNMSQELSLKSRADPTVGSSLPCKLKFKTPLKTSRIAAITQSQHNAPDSTTSGKTTVGDASVLVPAVVRKSNGSRMYNKRQYCLYCSSAVQKISRHLERVHLNEIEVSRALSFPKGSHQRKLQLEFLRNKGNFAHNAEVIKTGSGILVPFKQPKKKCEGQDFLHCVYCQGLFMKRVLWRHMQSCKFQPSCVKSKPGKTRVQSLCAFAEPAPSAVSESVWKMVNNMTQDDISLEVKNDHCIMEFGKHLYNRLGADVSKHEYIRQKLRELGRLCLHGREVTPLQTIKDYVTPENFMLAVTAVRHTAGFNEETSKYKTASLALKLGHGLKNVSMLLETDAMMKGDSDGATAARCFRQVYDARWNELISAKALQGLTESKWNSPQLLPFTEDVKTLHCYLDDKQRQFYSDLKSECSSSNWANLTKVTLAQVILFNRRREGEVSKMLVSTFILRDQSEPHADVNVALSELEKSLCKHFVRLEIRGKRGRKVPVLLTPAMVDSLHLLVEKRRECGVADNNLYMFARPYAVSHYRGSDCIRYFVKACGAKNPLSLTSTKLRKHVATLSKVLNLNDTELDQLADFLGHDIRVHRQFYRLPEGTLQLAKISKILMALEQGRLSEFKGMSLDDINIAPNETILCDKEIQEARQEENMPDCVVRSPLSPLPPLPKNKSQTIQLSPKSGRKPIKKKNWQKVEVDAVEKQMMHFIETCRVPGKAACDLCLKSEPEALKQRDWLAIKFYIKNRISALKRKM